MLQRGVSPESTSLRGLLIFLAILCLTGTARGANTHWVHLPQTLDSLVRTGDSTAADALLSQYLTDALSSRPADDSLRACIIDSLGGVLYSHRYYNEAESCFTRAYSIRREIFDSPHADIARSLLHLANVENIRGNFTAAQHLYREAISIFEGELGLLNEEVGWAYMMLAQNIKNYGYYDQSAGVYRQAYDIYEQLYGPDHIKLFHPLKELGLTYKHAGDYQKSVMQYLRASELALRDSGAFSDAYIGTRYNLLQVYIQKQEYQTAISYGREVDSLCTRGNPACQFYPLNQGLLGDIYLNLTDFDQAEYYYLDGVKKAREIAGDEHEDVAVVLFKLAEYYYQIGRYAEAEESFLEATRIQSIAYWFYSRGDFYARCLHKLGDVYIIQGRYSEAESIYIEARNLRENIYGSQHHYVGQALLDLSHAYEHQGRLDEAEAICREAVELFEKSLGRNHIGVAGPLLRLTEVLFTGARYNSIDSVLQRVLQIYDMNLPADHINVASTKIKRLKLHRILGDHDRAFALLSELTGPFTEPEPAFSLAAAEFATEAAKLYCAAEQFDSTACYYHQAVAVYEELLPVENPRIAEINLDVAVFYASHEEYEASLPYFRRFFESREQFLRYVFESSSEDQKFRWIQRYSCISDELLSVITKTESEELLQLALQMIVFSKAAVLDAVGSERRAAFCRINDDFDSLFVEYQLLCSDIADRSLAAINAHTPSLQDQIQRLQRRREEIESGLSRFCADFSEYTDRQPIQYRDIVQSIPEKSCVFDFIKYRRHKLMPFREAIQADEHYLAFMHCRDGTIKALDAGPVTYIDSLITAMMRQVNQAANCVYVPLMAECEVALAATTHQLYEALLAPFASSLGGRSRLIISPDSRLWQVPFEILSVGENRYLIEDYEISYLTSGRYLVPTDDENPIPESRVLLVADPDYDAPSEVIICPVTISSETGALAERTRVQQNRGRCIEQLFLRLPHARKEIHAIAHIVQNNSTLGVDALIGDQATEFNVKQLCEAPRIVHMATHSMVCTDLNDSNAELHPLLATGLALAGANSSQVTAGQIKSDGILTAMEIAAMNFHGTELVILSACETGSGELLDGAGILGLPRSFLIAGAESVVYTLWRITDAGTIDFVHEFYRQLFSGQSQASALREAKLSIIAQLRKQHGHSHPLIWGGFVLQGKP